MGEVLAQLGRVHARGGGELLARDRGDPLLSAGVEHPQVDREAGDRRLRDALTAVAGDWAAGHSPVAPEGSTLRARGLARRPQGNSYFTVRPCERMHKVAGAD